MASRHPNGGRQANSRVKVPGYYGGLLERRVEDALKLQYWVVQQGSTADHNAVDFVLRSNLRILNVPRPILIQCTTYVGNETKLRDFVRRARRAFGDLNALLYIEAEVVEREEGKHLVFDEVAVQSAVGNIVAFFKKATDPSVFLLQLTESKNSFRALKSFDADEASPAERAAAPRSVISPAGRQSRPISSKVEDGTKMLDRKVGFLTSWRCSPDLPGDEFGWITAGQAQFHAGTTVWEPEDLHLIREHMYPLVNDKCWSNSELKVSFREEPPYPGEKWPRAVAARLER